MKEELKNVENLFALISEITNLPRAEFQVSFKDVENETIILKDSFDLEYLLDQNINKFALLSVTQIPKEVPKTSENNSQNVSQDTPAPVEEQEKPNDYKVELSKVTPKNPVPQIPSIISVQEEENTLQVNKTDNFIVVDSNIEHIDRPKVDITVDSEKKEFIDLSVEDMDLQNAIRESLLSQQTTQPKAPAPVFDVIQSPENESAKTVELEQEKTEEKEEEENVEEVVEIVEKNEEQNPFREGAEEEEHQEVSEIVVIDEPKEDITVPRLLVCPHQEEVKIEQPIDQLIVTIDDPNFNMAIKNPEDPFAQVESISIIKTSEKEEMDKEVIEQLKKEKEQSEQSLMDLRQSLTIAMNTISDQEKALKDQKKLNASQFSTKKEEEQSQVINEMKDSFDEVLNQLNTLTKKVVKLEQEKKESTSEPLYEDIVHRGITCDVCSMSPIKGIRYKCLNCYNFDMCHGCETKGNHNQSHMLVKCKTPVQGFRMRKLYNSMQNSKGKIYDGMEFVGQLVNSVQNAIQKGHQKRRMSKQERQARKEQKMLEKMQKSQMKKEMRQKKKEEKEKRRMEKIRFKEINRKWEEYRKEKEELLEFVLGTPVSEERKVFRKNFVEDNMELDIQEFHQLMNEYRDRL